jgi:hypothetical protein
MEAGPLGFGSYFITHGYLHKNMKKVKNEYLGQYVTRYSPLGFETSFTVTEETAEQAEHLTSVGLGYLFEEAEPKSKKYKAVENESNEA